MTDNPDRLTILQIAHRWADKRGPSYVDSVALDLLVVAQAGGFEFAPLEDQARPVNYNPRLKTVVECFTRAGQPLHAAAITNLIKAVGETKAVGHVLVSMEGLRRWCDQAGSTEWMRTRGLRRPSFAKPTPAAVARQSGQYSLQVLRDWYLERISEHQRADGRPPSRDDDWTAAKAKFGSGVPRDAVWKLRRELAPLEWKKLGRRKKNVAGPKSGDA